MNNSSNTPTGPSFGGLQTVTAIGGGQANLVWSPAIDLNGGTITYNVYGAIGTTSGSEVFITSTTNPTGITLSGLTPDPWIFLVQAVDANGTPDTNTAENEVPATIT
jgi:hypothetical protein